MRMNSLQPKAEYVEFAKKIAELMPAVGMDRQRGGWYDVVERTRQPGEQLPPPSSGTTARPGGSRSRASWPT